MSASRTAHPMLSGMPAIAWLLYLLELAGSPTMVCGTGCGMLQGSGDIPDGLADDFLQLAVDESCSDVASVTLQEKVLAIVPGMGALGPVSLKALRWELQSGVGVDLVLRKAHIRHMAESAVRKLAREKLHDSSSRNTCDHFQAQHVFAGTWEVLPSPVRLCGRGRELFTELHDVVIHQSLDESLRCSTSWLSDGQCKVCCADVSNQDGISSQCGSLDTLKPRGMDFLLMARTCFGDFQIQTAKPAAALRMLRMKMLMPSWTPNTDCKCIRLTPHGSRLRASIAYRPK